MHIKCKIRLQSHEGYRFIATLFIFLSLINQETRVKEQLDNSQYGFRKGRSTQDIIFIVRQSIDKCISKNREIHIIN